MDTSSGSQKRTGEDSELQPATERVPKVFISSADEPWANTELLTEAKTLEAAQWQAA